MSSSSTESTTGEENPLLGELSERQFRESLDVLLEMTSSDDEQQRSNRTSPLSESLLSAATSAVLGGVSDEISQIQQQQQSAASNSSTNTAVAKPASTSTPTVAAPFAGSMATLSAAAAAPTGSLLRTTTTTLPVVPYFATSSCSTTPSMATTASFFSAAPTTTTSAAAAGVVASTAPQDTKIGVKRRISAVAPISEDEEEEWMKRRQGRNAREQQRAQQITQQITQLRNLLQSFQLEFKPDKFTTLLTATNYIQELQRTSASLSAEHKSVLKTLQQTTEHLHHPLTTTSATTTTEAALGGVVPYRGVFHACPTALCLINLDGRFVDANPAFERMHQVATTELVEKRKSLFNLIQRPDIEGMFCAMSQLLAYHPQQQTSQDNDTKAPTEHANTTNMDSDTDDSFVRTVRLVVDTKKKDTAATRTVRCCLRLWIVCALRGY